MALSKARCGSWASGVWGVMVQWYVSVEEWWIVARIRSAGWGMYWLEIVSQSVNSSGIQVGLVVSNPGLASCRKEVQKWYEFVKRR